MMRIGRLIDAEEVLAEPVEYATGFFMRLKGLLGRRSMDDRSAMIIERCSSVHTVGMRFALDLIFLDKEWRVVSIQRNVRPGKPMVTGGLRAKRVVESQAGGLNLDHLQVGDQLHFFLEGSPWFDL